MDRIADSHGRTYRKLRVSVTDRCPFRCTYCMPDGPADGWLPRREILSFEAIVRFAEWVVPLGVTEIRLTGGEPLLRRNLDRLVVQLSNVPGVHRVALTTSGTLLPRQIEALRVAGLSDLTVSIDALDADRFAELSGGGKLADVLAGIESALEVGYRPKLNMVAIRDRTIDQIVPLLEFAAERGCELRMIEYMPFGARWGMDAVVRLPELIAHIEATFGAVEPIDVPHGSTARRFRLPALGSTFGIIPTVSGLLCGECDRIRLTADGRVLHCLFDQQGRSIREPLLANDRDAALQALIGHVAAKGPGFLAEQRAALTPLTHMHRAGG